MQISFNNVLKGKYQQICQTICSYSRSDVYISAEFVSISHHKEEKKCTEASHLNDHLFLFHLKFSFVDNDVDNFIKLFILLMSWNLKNAKKYLIISLLAFRRMFLLSLSLLCCYLASVCWNFIFAANKVSLTVTPGGGWLTLEIKTIQICSCFMK